MREAQKTKILNSQIFVAKIMSFPTGTFKEAIMHFSSIIRASLISAASVVLLVATGAAQAAPKNGNDIVYNKSDCGRPNVRFYDNGGDTPGSKCSTWGLKNWQLETVWSDGNHNWSSGEIGLNPVTARSLINKYNRLGIF
jgi:hypothetical protein